MRILLFIVFSAIVGCGTIANLDQCPRPFISSGRVDRPVRIYGGVRNDIEWVEQGIGFPESVEWQWKPGSATQPTERKRRIASFQEDPVGILGGIPIFGYFAFVDPVLSFCGDTLTLPRALREIQKAECELCHAEQPKKAATNCSEIG